MRFLVVVSGVPVASWADCDVCLTATPLVVCVGTVTELTQLRPEPLEAPSLPDPEQISDRQSSVRMCANKSLLPTLLDTCCIGTRLSTLQMNPAA
ncbi:hypothetical protein Pmani_000991 [Petrolisthes manimaculis]|uniref:Secreted protein n=1 Tax=Petrolisthes manimaculis TaxID=1843537 RepID=A0AAE1QKZ4_9EUCA|nr:hypothetical protein Pmani_000991 [Petrolisthes manimaculis]